MNRTLKAIIVALALIVFGAVLAGCGLMGLNGAWDMLSGKNNMVTTQDTITADFTNIDIDVFGLDVELLPSPDGTCYYQATTYESMPCTVSVENGTLKVFQHDNRKFHEHIGIFWNDTILKLYLPKDAYETLTVTGRTSDLIVPASFRFHSVTVDNSTGDIEFDAQVEDNMNLTCSTGDIRISGAALKNLSAHVSTGDIYINNTTCDNLSARTTTGDLFVKDSDVAGDLSLNSSTGSKLLSNVTCGSLNSRATSGDLEMTNVIVSGNAVITANTGVVEFHGFDAASISITTSTGDVEGTLLSGKVFSADTSTGDIRMPQSTTGGLCEITTSTGDIDIKIAN